MDKPADAEREVAIQVMVPPAVHKQVALMSVQHGESMRAVVLRGLKAIGVEVPDEELVDRRGRRRRG
jgi:hypothetical protein